VGNTGTTTYYWSSSQYYDYGSAAWLQIFSDGLQDFDGKYLTGLVRAVRAF
jgi:hypothetical protein